eukprot:5475076-Pyramimonas_sp.AAC.2
MGGAAASLRREGGGGGEAALPRLARNLPSPIRCPAVRHSDWGMKFQASNAIMGEPIRASRSGCAIGALLT